MSYETVRFKEKMMQYSKLQIGCMILVLYITWIYVHERHTYKIQKREKVFEWLLTVGILEILFDGLTAYTVNHLDQVPAVVNAVLHMFFLCSLDASVFLLYLYVLDITRGIPQNRKNRFWLGLPFLLDMIVVVLFMPQLEYRKGEITNYSMGISAYTCFVMVAVYMAATLRILLMSWRSLDSHKQIAISTYMVAAIGITGYQMLYPQSLVSSVVTTIAIIGTYLNMENPVFTKLQTYNQEMVMGFATLVENRDDSTGGHIKRTTEYVRMLAEELRQRGFFKKQLTQDYIENLVMAAPMHDVGKIAIQDAILQKPGKLTAEEYEIMKTHAERGGRIIKETFGHMGDAAYEKVAYEVARHHHEKWNGTGYPDGLSQEEIPLSARIMAVADVFDAVSAKRCYRDALPLEECFGIIEAGKGTDFDPVITEVFLEQKEKITQICEKNRL